MKIGYSLILGEFFKAEILEYRDCERFQIVCPVCKEPIFKVEAHRNEKPIEYLSHYKKEASFDQDCELRAKSISKENIENKNNETRQQKLKYFMEILRKIILGSEYPQNSEHTRKVKYLFKLINRSKALVLFRNMVYENCKMNMRDSLTEKELHEIFNDYISDIEKSSGKFINTSFSIHIQKRIAGDIWKHLLASNTEKNWVFLFNYSYSFFMSRLRLSIERGNSNDWEVYLYNKMDKLLQCSQLKGKQILSNLSKYPLGQPFASGVDNLLGKMAAEITHEMLGCLLRLPYFEYLRENTIKANA